MSGGTDRLEYQGPTEAVAYRGVGLAPGREVRASIGHCSLPSLCIPVPHHGRLAHPSSLDTRYGGPCPS